MEQHPNAALIDLRSDTVTRPTPAMRQAMAESIVGDDQYGEDPTVDRLEALAAEKMGKEAAVYVPSGTMGNIASLMAWCGRGDEVILGDESHIYWFESGSPAALGGITQFILPTELDGTIDVARIEKAIRPARAGYPRTAAIGIENTHNRRSGRVLPMAYLRELKAMSERAGVPVHMDGARIFNAAAALGVPAAEIAQYADSVQFCLSKGLAAPVGSIVTGTAAFIERVRQQRKMLGGAMRQSGVIAAAGLVALETMVDRLPEDHARAMRLAEGLARDRRRRDRPRRGPDEHRRLSAGSPAGRYRGRREAQGEWSAGFELWRRRAADGDAQRRRRRRDREGARHRGIDYPRDA